LHSARKLSQHLIACKMAYLVVNALEEVDIDNANGKDITDSIATIFFCLHGGHENATIENAS
jgi:hypothetical protein